MNLRRIFYFFLLWLIPLTLSAQRYISGRIIDTDGGAPISGVHVFIANTTAGTTTDAEGFYRLVIPCEGSYRLAVTHVAYQPVFRDIEQGTASEVLDIALQIYELEGIEITQKVSVRKLDIDLFWKTLLGKNPSKKSIHAINSEDVYFFYNTETKKLMVTCRVPLQIVNYETGYHIRYVLNYFTHDHSTGISSWEGEYMFTELEPKNYWQKELWEKNRNKVYQVCIANFVRSLYYQLMLKNGFLFTYHQNIPEFTNKFYLANPDNFLSTDSVGNKVFYIPPSPADTPILLVCYGKPVSGKELRNLVRVQQISQEWVTVGLFRHLITTPEPVHIFPDGTFRNPILWRPINLSDPLTGLNMVLPIDYRPDNESNYNPNIIR